MERLTRLRRAIAALAVIAATTLVLIVAGASSAQAFCAPGVSDGKSPPVPVMPDTGISGTLLPEPANPSTADPFAPGSAVSIQQVYGLNWVQWHTYDLGCGGQLADPGAATDTNIANTIISIPTTVTAVTSSLAHYAYDPSSWLGKLDPAITAVATGLWNGITTPLAPLALIAAGVFVIWYAHKLRLAQATSIVLLIITALAVIFMAANYPVRAGHAADTAMQSGAATVSAAIDGRGDSTQTDPSADAVGPFVDHVLYTHWLAGLLGSADSATAKKYGPRLFKDTAVSYAEAAKVRGDAGATNDLYKAKQDDWAKAADEIKNADPDAYTYLTGSRDGRTWQALWSTAASYVLLFPAVAFLLMMAGYLVIRFVVMTAPAWATMALIPSLSGVLKSALGVVAASVVNPIIMVIGATTSVLLTGYLLDPANDLGWLGLMLSILINFVMWMVLKPYRRLTSLATGNPVKDATKGMENLKSSMTGFVSRAAATAAGVAAGRKLSPHADDEDEETVAAADAGGGVAADGFRRPEPPTITDPAIEAGPVHLDATVHRNTPETAGTDAAVAALAAPATMHAIANAPNAPAELDAATVRALTAATQDTEDAADHLDATSRELTDATTAIGSDDQVQAAGERAGEETVRALEGVVVHPDDTRLEPVEAARQPEPTVIDGQEVYVIWTPDQGVHVDTDQPTAAEDAR